MGLSLSYNDITQGTIVNGIPVDPVTNLLSQLAAAFAPLGEEARIQAMSEIMSFHRQNPQETTDALIQRFKMLKCRAAQGNAGINMTWEGYSWLLLKAVGLNQNTLIQLLQPTMGSMPNTEPQFEAMCMALRRLGHIFENSPHNLAHSLHTPQEGCSRYSIRVLQQHNRPDSHSQSPRTLGKETRETPGVEVSVPATRSLRSPHMDRTRSCSPQQLPPHNETRTQCSNQQQTTCLALTPILSHPLEKTSVTMPQSTKDSLQRRSARKFGGVRSCKKHVA